MEENDEKGKKELNKSWEEWYADWEKWMTAESEQATEGNGEIKKARMC
jgi:hypothetical protein